MNREVFAAVADALERGEPAALVTIVSTTGSTPQRVGAKMLVFGDGRIVGTIGGGCYENDAFGKAREAILTRKPQVVHYELDDDFAQETGLVCGGQMDVYIEPIEPSPELYVIGAGHVGLHLARLAQEVGFNVHVADDREKFANAERFPTAAEIVVDDIPAWIARANLPPHAYAVIVTRGHTNDLEALRALAPRELRYLGLIGSRAKVARIYEELSKSDMPADALARVHAPIGLDIGAVTPQEIAVSILPGLIQTHIHLCQTLFRGYADDLKLMDWLRTRVWPMEAAHTPDTLRAAARLAATELLASGTTAVLTMETVHDTDVVFEEVQKSGLRATIGQCMMDFDAQVPKRLQEQTRASLDESVAIRKRWDGAAGGRLQAAVAPRFAVSCSRELLEAGAGPAG